MDNPQLEAKVLIVDDEPGIRTGVRRVLTGCGAQVEMAQNGAEAIQRMAEEDFDVAIVDLLMPQLDGMGVLHHLAETESTVVPLVITAHATIETAIEAMRLGAYDYLPKPFVPMELIVRVERAIRWRRLRQEADRLLLEIATDKTQLRTIVDSLADAVIIVNVEDQVVLSNPAACETLGLAAPLREPCAIDLITASPELLELIREAAGAREGSPHSVTGRLEIGDRVFMARVAPVLPPGGGLRGTATVLRDITELTRLEEAKSQFMSLVAHELKAPLAAVQGFLKVILSGQELPPEKQTQLLERCSERIEGMAQMVRDLLDLSKSDVAPERRLESLDLREIMAEVVDQNEPLAERSEVEVELRLAECPPLHADRDDLLRIFGNLVSNAIKYNHPGGKVTVTSRNQGDRLWVEVADTGLGIPPEAMARLGEEFYRVNTPERRGIVGTGLGLSLVKRTLAAYGATLQIDSTPGEGSRFTVLWPWGAASG